MSTETKNSVTKTYTWTMANLLAGVASSDPNEIDVTYAYTGDLKRGWRLENGRSEFCKSLLISNL